MFGLKSKITKINLEIYAKYYTHNLTFIIPVNGRWLNHVPGVDWQKPQVFLQFDCMKAAYVVEEQAHVQSGQFDAYSIESSQWLGSKKG